VVREADRARGDIDVIKGQFFSAIVSGFGKTLCDIVETHLLKISFCDHRGTSSRVAVRSNGTASNRLIYWLDLLSLTVYTTITKWRTGD